MKVAILTSQERVEKFTDWSLVLNSEEVYRSKGSPARVFCPCNMLVCFLICAGFNNRLEKAHLTKCAGLLHIVLVLKY